MTSGLDIPPAWVAADWGTTQLRVWLLAADGSVLARKTSDKGMGRISPDAYEGVLLELIGDALPTEGKLDVVICGMAGSRQGWSEAPYAATPCPPPSIDMATHVTTQDARLNVHILPGVKQMSPADVMRGEETQIMGVTARDAQFNGVICLPGTHTKWARVQAGQITEFATFMSGELFNVIGDHSVLRHSVGRDGWNETAFRAACVKAIENPNTLMQSLFGLRAEALVADLSPEAARATLSGLLLGAELTAAQSYWDSSDVTIVGENALSQAYAAALATQGKTPRIVDAEETTLNGLKAAHSHLQESQS
ncbi:2-dehydro-3-deoxygalactonokinase [Epibacterium ulvae]|uniref:2-dehydro-3-deoxygalactonokinase n=1 Tax=Epibacterium ulvae TaxID=1156985 RepID=UPI00249073CF|nr:2-dehydro-3-deoxygalactonokinase [Epibacterium ulvae]